MCDGAGSFLVETLKAFLQRVHLIKKKFNTAFSCLLALHLLKVEPGGLDNQVELRIMFPISHHPGLLVLPLSGAGVKRRLELAHDFSFDLRAADESVKASGSYGISRKSCSLHLFITETIRQEQGCH